MAWQAIVSVLAQAAADYQKDQSLGVAFKNTQAAARQATWEAARAVIAAVNGHIDARILGQYEAAVVTAMNRFNEWHNLADKKTELAKTKLESSIEIAESTKDLASRFGPQALLIYVNCSSLFICGLLARDLHSGTGYGRAATAIDQDGAQVLALARSLLNDTLRPLDTMRTCSLSASLLEMDLRGPPDDPFPGDHEPRQAWYAHYYDGEDSHTTSNKPTQREAMDACNAMYSERRKQRQEAVDAAQAVYSSVSDAVERWKTGLTAAMPRNLT